MMPEKKRAPHQSGRGKGNVSQIQGHLCDKTADELLTCLLYTSPSPRDCS